MSDRKDAIAILLAEFQALRGEIAGRSAAQATIIQLAVTAFGALVGLALTQNGDHRLLLLIPVISVILGLIWFDHATSISNIGNFIAAELMPALKTEADMATLPDYEIFVKAYEHTPGGFFRMFGLPPFLIFILIPVVPMFMSLSSSSKGWLYWILFLIDIGLLSVLTKRWVPFLGSPRQQLPVK